MTRDITMATSVRSKADSGLPPASIIVVLYNSRDFIERCIESISRLEYPDFEVILVDNGSKDGSADLARKVLRRTGISNWKIINRRWNLGFASANNQGIGYARGELIAMVNPDTELYPDWLREISEVMLSDPTVGVAGSKIYYPDRKTLQHAGGTINANGLTNHYGADEEDRGQYDFIRDVGYVTGAALVVRRDLFDEVGLLDPFYYPAYFEETDLCLRVRRKGYRVVYVPKAALVHYESTTVGKFSRRFLYLYHKNRIRFILKNFSLKHMLRTAYPFEKEWLVTVKPKDDYQPLARAYLVNLLMLPQTLYAHLKTRKIRKEGGD